MNATLSALRAAAGRTGGLRRSPAQLRQLRAVHQGRRGVRQHDPGISRRALGILLADVQGLIRTRAEPGRISLRAAAAAVGVSDRTLRRWLRGEDWPPSTAVQALQSWLRSVTTGAATT